MTPIAEFIWPPGITRMFEKFFQLLQAQSDLREVERLTERWEAPLHVAGTEQAVEEA